MIPHETIIVSCISRISFHTLAGLIRPSTLDFHSTYFLDDICFAIHSLSMIIHILPSLIRFKFPHGEYAKVCQEFVSGKPVRLSIYDWDQELIDYKYIQPVYGKVQRAPLYISYVKRDHL